MTNAKRTTLAITGRRQKITTQYIRYYVLKCHHVGHSHVGMTKLQPRWLDMTITKRELCSELIYPNDRYLTYPLRLF